MKFDMTKLVQNKTCPMHRVDYIVYEERDTYINRTIEDLRKDITNKKIVGKENSNKICFVGLRGMYFRDANRILFKVNFNQKEKTKLSHPEIIRWVSMCKFRGLMPTYIGNHFIDTSNFILKLGDLSQSRIYIALNAARYIQEYPETIRATFYFRDLGLDFYLAFLAAHKLTLYNVVHSIYSQVQEYATKESIHNTKLNPAEALALKLYILNGYKEDRSVKEELRLGKPSYTKLHNILKDIQKDLVWKPGLVTIPELFSKEIQNKVRFRYIG